MFAWHVHAVFVLVAADHASIRMTFLTDQCHLDLADVGLVGADLEDCLVLDHEELAAVALKGEALPCSVGGAHVFNVELVVGVGDGRMEVAEVLVVLEVQQVVGLPANGHLGFWDFYDCVMSWALDDRQT